MARKEFTTNKPNFSERKILIVCEDKKSFPNYFDGLLIEEFGLQCDNDAKKEFKKNAKNKSCESNFYKTKKFDQNRKFIKIQICHPGKTNPLGIVKFAKQNSANCEMVFVVFDALTKQDAGNYECYKQALGLKAGDNVVKIISNPSYEFWILLHFSESAQSFTNNEKLIEKLNEKVRSELGKHFEYNKSGINKNLLNLMLKNTTTAIKRAKTISKDNHRNNPSTEIYKIIEYLQTILDLS